MRNEHKNFEDRLRNRLHNEELPYDAGAWEGFQNQQEINRKENPEEVSNNKKFRIGFWKWFLLSINLLIVVSVLGYYYQNHDNHEIAQSKDESQINKSVSHNGALEDDNNIEPDNLNSKTKLSETLLEKTDGIANHDKSTNGNSSTSGVGVNSGSISSSRESENNDIGNNENKVFEDVNSGSIHFKENGNIVEKNATVRSEDLKDEQQYNMGDGAMTNNSKVNANLSLRGENLDFENSITISEKEHSKNSLVVDFTKVEADIEKINLAKEVSFASIGKIDFQGFVLPEITGFDMPIIIEPLKYKKNEFYIGAGYVNKFFEFTTKTTAGRGTNIFPTYISLGYFRKLSPSWSLGIEAHIMHLQKLKMSRELQDYHQTSTSFEYIEGTYSHSHSNYIGLPLILKYQPLGVPIGVYGGLNMAYTLYSGHRYDNEHQGENIVINYLRANHSASQYYKNWDAGLIAGATIKIWKGLELEGRAVFGLVDVSGDYFWGESTTRTSHYRVGLKYKFLK